MVKQLRCWKKKGKNDWARVLDRSLVTVDVMQETGGNDFLFRRVEHRVGSNVGQVKVRSVGKKSQAVKLAKTWMKKHDKC